MNALQLTNKVLEMMKSTQALTLAVISGDQVRALGWVNLAIEDICMKPVIWRFLRVRNITKNTVVGQQEYSATDLALSNLRKFDLNSFAIDNKRLSNCDYDDLRYADRTGEPVAVSSPEPTSIYFSHEPDSIVAFTFDYFRTHPALALDADTPLIPEAYHSLIVDFALMHYAQFDDAPEIFTASAMNGARMYKQLYREQAIVYSGSVL